MNLTKRIGLTWRMIRIIPKLDYLERTLPKLEALEWAIPKLEALEVFIPKLEALQRVLDNLQEIEKKMPEPDVMDSMIAKLDNLYSAIEKVESFGHPIMSVRPSHNGNELVTKEKLAKEEEQKWARLKLISRFVQVSNQAEQVEKEWQAIQQREHDFKFAFDTTHLSNDQNKFLYTKGITDGIKWCLNRFS